MPRERLADLPAGTRDPMAILDAQDASRVPELVPIRTERMAESPVAFYRGTAALMAADLARSPGTTLRSGPAVTLTWRTSGSSPPPSGRSFST